MFMSLIDCYLIIGNNDKKMKVQYNMVNFLFAKIGCCMRT